MSSIDAFKKLAFKVLLKPAPRTQSESKAVLQYLQDLGPVSTFQIVHRTQDGVAKGPQESKEFAVANLVFARSTKAVDSLTKSKARQNFTVTANANIPPLHVQDPYNARGIKYRKPDLDPKDIECRLIPFDDRGGLSQDETALAIEDMEANEYSGPFAVDRGSILTEVLAKTDAPSGLIHGLLPKLEERHRSSTHSLDQPVEEEPVHKDAKRAWQGFDGQKPNRRTEFVRFKLQHNEECEDQAQKEVKANGSSGKPYDEFAKLRGVSLMQMYREAISEHGNAKSEPASNFVPFRDRN